MALGSYPKEVTADSGYCSEKNLILLKEKQIKSYIKLQTHETMKTKAYQEDIRKYYNLPTVISEDEYYCQCHDGRQLAPTTEKRKVVGANINRSDGKKQ